MIEINVSAWGDWDDCINYIKAMQKDGFKIKLFNVNVLFELWYDDELLELGFKKHVI